MKDPEKPPRGLSQGETGSILHRSMAALKNWSQDTQQEARELFRAR